MVVYTFKPKITIPEGFVLVVDTREQTPLFDQCEWVVYKKLDQGDYSVLGFESVVAVERKSKSDLLASLGVNRKRFKQEIERLMDYEWKGLVIECSEKELYVPTMFSLLNFQSLYHSISSLEVRGFHVYYAATREHARDWVLSRLVKFYKLKRGIK